jgi:hypothetical protein
VQVDAAELACTTYRRAFELRCMGWRCEPRRRAAGSGSLDVGFPGLLQLGPDWVCPGVLDSAGVVRKMTLVDERLGQGGGWTVSALARHLRDSRCQIKPR